jgi:putative DNA primase/helicase
MRSRRDPLPRDLLGRADIAGMDAGGSGKLDSATTSATPSTPIFAELPTAIPFPVDALPVGTRRFIKEASRATGCPPDLVAMPTLAMLSAGIGASRVVRLKRTWSESAALFLVVVASPGSKKTPAQRVATEPVWAKQAELMRKYRIERETYEAECRQWEVDKRKAREDERPEPEPPDEPVMDRTVVEDTTVEALYSVIEANPRGVLDIEDELSGWVRRMDQYKGGKGADRQFFLGVWGNSPVVVDRKGKGEPTIIHRPWLSLIGSIQPAVLWEVAAKREDGMLDRFLCSYPDTPPARLSDDDVSQETSDQVRGLYDKLASLQLREGENGEPLPGVVHMAPDAWEVFKELSGDLQDEAHAPGFPARLQGVWSKLEAYLARLSLILALPCAG